MMLGSGGGASITTGSSGGGGQGQSSGHHRGRGPGSSLEDPLSSPPELSGGMYGGCSDGGSEGGMNGYGNRGGLGLNLSIIAGYSFARDWDDETRRDYYDTTRTGASTWFRGMREALRRSRLVGKLHNYGTNPTPNWIRGGFLSLAVANTRVRDILRGSHSQAECRFSECRRDTQRLA
jgi:hypothetical protein